MHKGFAALAVLFLFGSVAASYLRHEPATAAASAPLVSAADKKIITPHPRVPRNMTLDPSLFKDPETRKAYQVAKDKPELLEHMACYCGCMS